MSTESAELCAATAACVRVAQTVFKIPNLRFGQLEAAVAAVEQKDAIVVLPTGAGKSRCFQLVPYLLQELGRPRGLVIVIQPLVTLLKGQVSVSRAICSRSAADGPRPLSGRGATAAGSQRRL